MGTFQRLRRILAEVLRIDEREIALDSSLAELFDRHAADSMLAVSNTDGNAMRIIGVLGTEPGDQYYRHRRLTWLPDAKHVSFSHRGARWSVPVVP